MEGIVFSDKRIIESENICWYFSAGTGIVYFMHR